MPPIRDRSGAGIDRLELNTVMPRLGAMRLNRVTVDGAAVPATVDDQTIIVPLGGILPAGGSTNIRVRFGADLRTNLAGSNWLFAKANGIVEHAVSDVVAKDIHAIADDVEKG